ncbi:DUF4836 family protein [Chitinophaga sp. sic0106]|uniref:DUF4836 family protein n=1 Tax=Chitinophaga sp. sic0106 TaxID=2854785 RepID=UPI001C48C90C|nr:DUF4836 family protein [Chitinophaga sp. sic0106]MBV7528762.1 DUF4836 family protein [Chitinophaga sp. sic0106]
MKRTISKLLLTAGVAAVMLSACSKVPEESKYIPKEAGLVFELNAKQLSEKLVTNGFTMDKLMAAAQSGDSAKDAKSWEDAKNSGIDLTSNFFVSFVFRGQVNENKSYIEATASLKDVTKFENFLKTNLSGYEVKTGKDFKYTWDKKSSALITWNDKTVLYLMHLPTSKLNGLPGTGGEPAEDAAEVDAEAYPADTAAPVEAVATPVANVTAELPDEAAVLISEADHLYHLKEAETAGSLEPFKKLLKENADISLFFNSEATYNSGMLTMLPANFKKLMEGSYTTATANFEKGKVVMNTNSYAGKQMMEIFKKYGKREIDMDMLEKYPGENITGFIAYAFDFHMIGEIVKSVGMDGMVNMMLSQKSGLTMDDLLNAFDGQLVYVSSDFKMERVPNPYFEGDTLDKPKSNWIFNMKVANKEAFNKVMTSPLLANMFVKEGDKYVLASPDMAASMPAMSLTEKSITLGSDSVLLGQYLGGKGKIKLPEAVNGKVKGSMLYGYLDFEKLASAVPMNSVGEDEKAVVTKAKDLLKDLTISAKPISGDVQSGEVVLNFRDQNRNSLVQLVEVATEAAKVAKAKEEQRKREQAAEDSLYNLVPVDSAAIQ